MGEFPDPTQLVARARQILGEADSQNLTLRLIGALAFHVHCPTYNYIQRDAKRYFTDIDFMAYVDQKAGIEELFDRLGYIADIRVTSVPHLKRSIFFSRDRRSYIDVFYDSLDFSHQIDFRGRLEIDYPTVALVDLLLEKMQIVELNEKDVIDTVMLLREHDVGSDDDETVNVDYLAQTCMADWGLWKTVTTNLAKVSKLVDDYDVLTADDRRIIKDRLKRTTDRIQREPPTLRWRLRSRIGERLKWYQDVDEHW
ncbi:MAG: hypothetical protein PVG71_02945 [Anaerolineae bacterium]|jgi:hypothetical protein